MVQPNVPQRAESSPNILVLLFIAEGRPLPFFCGLLTRSETAVE